MPRNPFTANLRDKEDKRPNTRNSGFKGNTAREVPFQEDPGALRKSAPTNSGGRPGTISPGGAVAVEMAQLPNVMRPMIELDDFDYSGKALPHQGMREAQNIPRYAPDDASVVNRLFGINIEDV